MFHKEREIGMIQEFSIENTYSIKTRQTISFEATDDTEDIHCINAAEKKLLKLAAIYGANASGKSNIIKAFDFYIDFILNSFSSLKPHASIPFMPFMFDEETSLAPGNFEIVFFIQYPPNYGDIQYIYNIALDKERVHRESLKSCISGKETLLFERIWINKDYEYHYNEFVAEIDQLNYIQRMTRPNASFLSTSAQLNFGVLGTIYKDIDNLMILGDKSGSGYTSNVLLQQHSRISANDVIDVLKKASIDIDDIAINYIKTIGSPDFSKQEIFFSHKYTKSYILPYTEESKGTRQLFELTGLLLDSIEKTKNIFIDEIETSLHDDLLDFFVSTFINNSVKSQLLFTTHNQSLLDSELLSDDEIWFVQKDKTGGSEFFSLAEFKDIPPGISRRKLYKAGTFGALPFISTYTRDT
jgi:AAA15 family ATPase/GTPase